MKILPKRCGCGSVRFLLAQERTEFSKVEWDEDFEEYLISYDLPVEDTYGTSKITCMNCKAEYEVPKELK